MNIEQISAKLSGLPIAELSFSSKFEIHRDGQIKGYSFVLGFFWMLLQGWNTVEKWANGIAWVSGHLVSAQSVQGKLQFRHQNFAKSLLEYVLHHQLLKSKGGLSRKGLLKSFRRVFLEDSTCIKLPSNLAAFFPSSFNSTGVAGATARIQLRLDLLSGAYTHLEVQGYRDNDQQFAPHILSCLRAGDLVIRDMGYAVLSVLEGIMQRSAFFLSRFRYGTKVYDLQTGQEIDLLEKLTDLRRQGNSVLDMKVGLGKHHRLAVRLLALLAPPQVAQARCRKAQKDRNKKANHSPRYMEILAWSIFVTNVESHTWTPLQVLQVYGFRWHIEIIFKCWKSKFNIEQWFDKKQSMTPARAFISFYLLLLWLTLFFTRWYHDLLLLVGEHKNKCLSLLKFADFVKAYFDQLCAAQSLTHFVDLLARYYCYNKRKLILNMPEKIYLLILS